MSEESSSKKEEEFLGFPISKLGGPALVVGGLALVGTLYSIFKPQIEERMAGMNQRQAYIQQQQMLAAQEQQRQLMSQQQYQQGPSAAYPPQTEQQENREMSGESQPVEADPRMAVESDPFARNTQRRVRIPEIDASEQAGVGRFNNISV